MRKISKMYQWSGGTDYRHVCKECKNCIKVKQGSSQVVKCQIYGTEGKETDWKEAYIACKQFNGPVPDVPVYNAPHLVNTECDGQMSIEDFLKN